MLTDKGFEFNDISLSEYPEKRTDMLALADRLTVPQIFFNDKHIGGAAELDTLISTGEFDTLIESMRGKPHPADPRFSKPDYPPKEETKAQELTETCITVGEECLMHSDIVHILKEGLDIADRKYHAKTYAKCFVGSDAVDFLMKRFNLRSRQEAVQVGETMYKCQLLHHVTHDHTFKDAHLFYRLQIHSEPKALNTWRVWNDRVDDPFVTLKACKAMLNKIMGKHMDSNGMVDYVKVGSDEEFEKFAIMTCEFQKTALESLTDDAKKAFFINLYNLVVLHAFAQVGIPQNNLHRMSFFDHIGYAVAGHFFSLNDIENGVLRGNKTPPYHLNRMFAVNDPRKPFALPLVDHRIHFALNCGAKSCPPIKNFTAEAINEELRIAAMAFLEMPENLFINGGKKTVQLSKILSWYKSDFGSTDMEVAKTVQQYLRGDNLAALQALVDSNSVRIKHFTYDWGNNAKNFKAYNPDSLKTSQRCAVM